MAGTIITIYDKKNPDKIIGYKGTIDIPKDPLTGKRRRKVFYDKKKKNVESAMIKYKADIESGDFNEPTKLLFEKYMEQWLNVYCKDNKLSQTTIDGYNNYVKKHINPYLGKYLIGKILPIHIQDFYNKESEKKYSGTTILQIHRILHKAFKEAMRNKLINNNPCDMVDAPKPSEFTPAVYDDKDFIKLLNIVKGTYDELIIILAGMIGLRRSEIFGLKWDNVDFNKKTISINQVLVVTSEGLIEKETKNKSSKRSIAIPDNVIPILKYHHALQSENKLKTGDKYCNDNWVCCSKNGEKINGSSYSRRFGELLNDYGLKKIRFHDLRHFNATMMLKYGVDVKVAAQRLGHSTPAITQKIYQHVLDSMDEKAAVKLNKILDIKSNKNKKSG